MRRYEYTAGALLIATCVGCAAVAPSAPVAAAPSAAIDVASSASAAGSSTEQAANMQVASYAPATIQDEESTTAAMTLEDLVSIALAHTPAIKELAATTRKAAGYRAQVTARPNPRVGYQGQQLADEGTYQHLAFVE